MSNITNIGNVQTPAAVQAVQQKNTTNSQNANKTASVRVDQTAISNHSLLISKALNVSDVRTEKVANLQQAIANGTYNVSSSDVAGSLIKALQS